MLGVQNSVAEVEPAGGIPVLPVFCISIPANEHLLLGELQHTQVSVGSFSRAVGPAGKYGGRPEPFVRGSPLGNRWIGVFFLPLPHQTHVLLGLDFICLTLLWLR